MDTPPCLPPLLQRETNRVTSCLFPWWTKPFEKRVYSFRKEIALIRAISFPKELTPFENGDKNKNKWVTIPTSVFIRLKYEKTVMYGESLCLSRRLYYSHSLKEIISQTD